MKPTILKISAVFSSLALANTFVWYQSAGKTRLMPASKSAAAPVEINPVAHRANYSAESDVVVFPEDSTLTPTQKEELRKTLIFSSKSGGIFTPDDTSIAAPAAKTTPAPAPESQIKITEPEEDNLYVNGGGPTLTKEQEREIIRAQKELMRAVKEELIREATPKQAPPPQPVTSTQTPPARPAQRRAIMSGSKSMVINLDRLPPTPNGPAQPPPQQQQQSQQQRRVLLPGSKSEVIRE